MILAEIKGNPFILSNEGVYQLVLERGLEPLRLIDTRSLV